MSEPVDLSRISDLWLLRGGPNGGYAAAVAVNALRAAARGRVPLSATVHFVSPAAAGAVEPVVRTLRTGHKHTTVQGELVQGGDVRVSAVATFVEPAVFERDETVAEPPGLPPVGEGVALPVERLAPGTFEQRLERRAAPEVVDFMTSGKPGPAEIGGWTRLRGGAPLDSGTVPVFMDSWPPPPHRVHGLQGRATTVDLTVHWRARPRGDWHFVWFEATPLQHGYVEIDGRLWRPDGTLVAQSRQLARYRPSQ